MTISQVFLHLCDVGFHLLLTSQYALYVLFDFAGIGILRLNTQDFITVSQSTIKIVGAEILSGFFQKLFNHFPIILVLLYLRLNGRNSSFGEIIIQVYPQHALILVDCILPQAFAFCHLGFFLKVVRLQLHVALSVLSVLAARICDKAFALFFESVLVPFVVRGYNFGQLGLSEELHFACGNANFLLKRFGKRVIREHITQKDNIGNLWQK